MAGTTDPAMGRATTSASIAVGFLALTTIALRGHVPGGAPAAPERTPDDPVAGVVVIVLLVAAVAAVAVAVLTRLRRPTPTAGRVTGRLDWVRADRGGSSRRAVLIAFGAILLWVLLAAMLSRLTFDTPSGGAAPDPAVETAPADRPPAAPEPPDSARVPAERDWNLLGYFYVATAAFVVVVVAGSVVAAARRRPRSAVPAAPHVEHGDRHDTQSEDLARAAEIGLAAVEDLTRDPRSSIIACWVAMERELARVPGASPRDFDTASEVLARAVDLNALRPDSATELVDLFEEARFSPHVMTERHRESAVDVLRRVLDELGGVT